jgi:hypothetical protein
MIKWSKLHKRVEHLCKTKTHPEAPEERIRNNFLCLRREGHFYDLATHQAHLNTFRGVRKGAFKRLGCYDPDRLSNITEAQVAMPNLKGSLFNRGSNKVSPIDPPKATSQQTDFS